MVGALKRRPSAARPIPIRRRSRLAAAAATQQPTTMPMAAATVTTGHRRHRHLTDMAAEGGRSLAVKYHSLIIYFINYLSWNKDKETLRCRLRVRLSERGKVLKEVGYRNASAWKKSFYLWPLTNASPAVTSVSPVNILKVVVLPAPFTPEVDMEKVSNIKRTFSLTTSFRHQMVQLYTWISCIQILRLNEKHKLTVNSLFEHSFYTFVVIYFRNICTLSAYIL